MGFLGLHMSGSGQLVRLARVHGAFSTSTYSRALAVTTFIDANFEDHCYSAYR